MHPQARRVREHVGGHRALRQLDREDRPEAGVAHGADRGVLREPPGEVLGVGLGPVEPHREGPQAAQREPGLERAGAFPIRSRRFLRTSKSSSDRVTTAPMTTSL